MTSEKQNEIVVDIETTGLHPWYGDRVTCICARDSNGRIFKQHIEHCSDEEEAIMISLFWAWCDLKVIQDANIITFNGKEFDIPFLLTRYTLTRHPCDDLYLRFANHTDIDLHEELRKLTGKRISLDTTAKLMGCDTKSGKGEDAIKLWKEGKYQELMDYCMQDVEVTWQVYQKWKELTKKED